MYMYNYLEAVTNDAKQAILENMNDWNFADREELEEIASDELWVDDNVTGNGSGSYSFNSEMAKEYVLESDDGLDTLRDAAKDYNCEHKAFTAFLEENWEYLDVTIRCYLLSQAISAAIDELEEEGKIQYSEEEEK
nr:MAG TPA: hypothetical protein [Caudoviricetes sp.]